MERRLATADRTAPIQTRPPESPRPHRSACHGWLVGLPPALKVYQKRKTEVAERRFFPASGVLFEEIVDDAIVRTCEHFKCRMTIGAVDFHNVIMRTERRCSQESVLMPSDVNSTRLEKASTPGLCLNKCARSSGHYHSARTEAFNGTRRVETLGAGSQHHPERSRGVR
jgi:hypothetical protein